MTAEQAIFAIAGPICVLSGMIAVTRTTARSTAVALASTLTAIAVLVFGLGEAALGAVLLAAALLLGLAMWAGASRLREASLIAPLASRPALGLAGGLLAVALAALVVVAALRTALPGEASAGAWPTGSYVALAGLLAGVAAFGMVARASPFTLLTSVQLLLGAAALTFAAATARFGQAAGAVAGIVVVGMAAGESVVALAIVAATARARGHADVDARTADGS